MSENKEGMRGARWFSTGEEEEKEFNPTAAAYLLLALLHGVGLGDEDEDRMTDGWEFLRNYGKNNPTESPLEGLTLEQTEKHFQELEELAIKQAQKGCPYNLEAGKHLYAMYEQHQFLGGPNAEGGGLRWFTIQGFLILHGTTWFNNRINHLLLNWRTCSICEEIITDEQFAEGLIDYPYCDSGSRFGKWTSHKKCTDESNGARMNGNWLFDEYVNGPGPSDQSAFKMSEIQLKRRIKTTNQ